MIFDHFARTRQVIGLHEARHLRTERSMTGGQFFVGAPARHHRHRLLRGRDQLRGGGDGDGQLYRRTVLHRLLGAWALEQLREITGLVAHPQPIHLGIVMRRDAIDGGIQLRVERVQFPLMLAVPDIDAAAALAPRADRLGGLQVPHAGMRHQLGGEQRTHRAEVDHVVGVDVEIEVGVFGGTDQRVIAAVHGAQRLRARYFVREPDAERAHDAPLVVQDDPVGQREELGGVRFRIA